MIKIENEIVGKLLDLYKKAEVNYEKDKELFYGYLCERIIESAEETGDKVIALKQYEMSVCAYLESNLISFNINVATLLISFATLFVTLFATLFKNFNSITGIVLIVTVAVVIIVWLLIKNHINERKLSEILFALRNINGK